MARNSRAIGHVPKSYLGLKLCLGKPRLVCESVRLVWTIQGLFSDMIILSLIQGACFFKEETMRRKWLRHAAILFVVFSLLLNPAYTTSVYALSSPGMVAPSNGVTTTPADTPPLAVPEFQWTAVSGATSYRIQVSNDIAFTTLVVDQTTPNTSYTPTATAAIPDGVWYWRVRAEAPATAGAYSSIWTFTKQWADPANAPTLTSPADFA